MFTERLELIDSSVREHTDAAIRAGRRAIIRARGHLRTNRFKRKFLLCRKPGTRNYGHWLTEMLPKAWLAREYAGQVLTPVIQAVPEPMRRIMFETLGLLGFDPTQIVELGEAPARFDSLVLVDGLSEHGCYLSPLVMECLQDLTGRIPARQAGKIVVTRGGAASRRFAGEPELFGAAIAAGFDIFDPSRASFAEQVGMFKGARTVVGAMGASMTNIAVMLPGSEVFVAAPDIMPDTFYWFLSGLRKLRYTESRCHLKAPQSGPEAWDGTILLDAPDQEMMFANRSPHSPHDDLETQEMMRVLGEMFDSDDYVAQLPEDARPPREAALVHYLEQGWLDGLAPSTRFDGDGYLLTYDDVAQSGINPLVHYMYYGKTEGRAVPPVQPAGMPTP